MQIHANFTVFRPVITTSPFLYTDANNTLTCAFAPGTGDGVGGQLELSVSPIPVRSSMFNSVQPIRLTARILEGLWDEINILINYFNQAHQ